MKGANDSPPITPTFYQHSCKLALNWLINTIIQDSKKKISSQKLLKMMRNVQCLRMRSMSGVVERRKERVLMKEISWKA
ncbi:CLUMA_CG006954, isoform A [Clunio marinus]|uniref:CLUMA_CG006954, isoform A n=1 Tax=Clunio marinus TaxID=568069 RepID=A0A1J1I0X8_9DIPT|nr:CLUMA_CG006954, isoform A [Clunio marinus]